jgi:site-specific recombinase XerD
LNKVIETDEKSAAVAQQVRFDLDKFKLIIRHFDRIGKEYSADDIISEFKNPNSELLLYQFMQHYIDKLHEMGRTRTCEGYASTLRNLKLYLNNRDIMLESIDSDLVEGYQSWLQSRGNAPNTTSYYIKKLRAIYYRAMDKGYISDNRRDPFKRVFTGYEKTVKRGLSVNLMKKIKEVDLSGKPKMEFARDIFMLSFYLRGMSMVDMTYLRKSDLQGGFVSYRRRKTRQQLTIKWTIEMQDIVDKYPKNNSKYLLPLIYDDNDNPVKVLANKGHVINYHLKKLGVRLGIPIPLTSYVARHSWATIARNKGVSLTVISEGLGHDNETTTRIYLANLDTAVIDKANDIVIKSLG